MRCWSIHSRPRWSITVRRHTSPAVASIITTSFFAFRARCGSALGAGAHPIPGGGYALPTNDGEVSVWLSPDGRSWTYAKYENGTMFLKSIHH